MVKKMGLLRLLLVMTTVTVVISFSVLFSLYARGYRFDKDEGLAAHGLLVIKSDPTGAKVFINDKPETATDDNISILPGTYDVEVRKEGYHSWKKRLTIEPEEVTEAKAHLFKAAPSLDSITFTGGANPIASRDATKIAYGVPISLTNRDKGGLWILETVNLPIGFSRDPRQITDGDLTSATWTWSPDDREILLEILSSAFLLDANEFTPQNQRINIGEIGKEKILEEWNEKLAKKTNAAARKLPDEFDEILERRVSQLAFSPDKDILLYTASSSAKLADNLIKPVPGASTQKQDRDIKPGHTYVYDIEEDRNFLIDDNSDDLIIESGYNNTKATRRLGWFPTSRNLVLAEENKITIMDLDGTNRQVVYSGSYSFPHAFPTVSTDRLIFLTNFGASDTTPNLYTLSLK